MNFRLTKLKEKLFPLRLNMVSNVTKKLNLSTEDLIRQKNIISKLNLAKLPLIYRQIECVLLT